MRELDEEIDRRGREAAAAIAAAQRRTRDERRAVAQTQVRRTLDRLTAERVARNQSTFRAANERIVAAAGEIGVPAHAVPFICECAETSCTAGAPDRPRRVLRGPTAIRRRFLHAAGHRDNAGVVVETHGSYIVVEKTGLVGEIAEELA